MTMQPITMRDVRCLQQLAAVRRDVILWEKWSLKFQKAAMEGSLCKLPVMTGLLSRTVCLRWSNLSSPNLYQLNIPYFCTNFKQRYDLWPRYNIQRPNAATYYRKLS